MKSNSRLVLGTAQLGLPYGVANLTGQPDPVSAEAILHTAWEGGIRQFDTAQAYGNSEEILGRVIQNNHWQDEIKIITKLSPDIDTLSHKAVFASVKGSLNRLGIPSVHGLLLHRENLLQQWDDDIGNIMKALIDSQLVESVGVSVYSPAAAIRALHIEGITAIQIPSNVFDRRFEAAGFSGNDSPKDKQIYIRSVFLQGLIFFKPDELPVDMMFAHQTLNQYETLVQRYGLSKLALALGYAKRMYPRANIIVGAETSRQVDECLDAWQPVLPDYILHDVQELFMNVDRKLLNPALWPN